MKLIRLASAAATAVLTICAFAATAASASAPRFNAPEFPVGASGVSPPGRGVTAGGTQYNCQSDDYNNSSILGQSTISGGTITGLNSLVIWASQTCTVKSVGAAHLGEIVSNTLKGELGTGKKSEAATGVGLLLEPETAKK